MSLGASRSIQPFTMLQIAVDPAQLPPGDALILHSLGVIWEGKKCAGKCNPKPC